MNRRKINQEEWRAFFYSSTDTSKNPKIKLASQMWRTANSFKFLDQEDHVGEESEMNLLKLARQRREAGKTVKASEHQAVWILSTCNDYTSPCFASYMALATPRNYHIDCFTWLVSVFLTTMLSSIHQEFRLHWGMSRVKEITLIWIGLIWQLWTAEWARLKRMRCKNPSLLHSVYTPSSFPPTPLPQSEPCFLPRRASAVMVPEVLQTVAATADALAQMQWPREALSDRD